MGARWFASCGSLGERCATLCPCFCLFHSLFFLPEAPLFDSDRLFWAPQYPSRFLGPSRRQAKAVASNAYTTPFPYNSLSSLPPLVRPPPRSARRTGRGWGGASTESPRPRSRLFLGPLPEPLRRLPRSPPNLRTASAPRSAPPPPSCSPSFG